MSELIHIPVCPGCGCPMYPSVGCMWPSVFTAWGCHCEKLLVIGDDDDVPSREFIDNYAQLLTGGYLSIRGEP